MTKKKWFCYLLCAISIIFVFAHYAQAADYETLGQTAESEGKLRTALTHYVKALQSYPEGSSNDIQLREKILKLAQKLHPSPAIPEEAEKHMARGEAFVEMATDKDGFQRAAKEFQAAAKVAPWMADAYYNLGIMQEKAGIYKQAMQSLEFYLLAAPNASDARDVRKLIYKIEVRNEEVQRQELKAAEELHQQELKAAEEEFDKLLIEIQQEQSEEYLLPILNRPWYVRFCQDLDISGGEGCNEAETKSEWKIYYDNNNRYETFNFKFPGNGTAEFEEQAHNAGKGVVKLIAIANGPELRDIEWECIYKDGHSKKAGFVATYNNQRAVGISCDRDEYSYSPMKRYRYIQFKKP